MNVIFNVSSNVSFEAIRGKAASEVARGDVSRYVDFSLKWGRNRKKIDILKIEFRTLITTLPHSIENIISWPKVVKSDRTTQGSRAVMTVAQSSRMRKLVTKAQIVAYIANPVYTGLT